MTTTLKWPTPYLRDEEFTLLRPLTFEECTWWGNPDLLLRYLMGQVRRLGSRGKLVESFKNLGRIARGDSPIVESFFNDPLTPVAMEQLSLLRTSLVEWLSFRFSTYPEDPWTGFPWEEISGGQRKAGDLAISEEQLLKIVNEEILTLTEKEKRRLIKQEQSKLSWDEWTRLASEQIQRDGSLETLSTTLLERALRENAASNAPRWKPAEASLAQVAFTPASDHLEVRIPEDQDFIIGELPIFLGKHFLPARVQRQHFNEQGAQFKKIIGAYARWDNAPVAFFREKIKEDNLINDFFRELSSLGYRGCGPWNSKLSGSGERIYMVILVPTDFPENQFYVAEWSVNVKHFSLNVEKQTTLTTIAS